MKPPITEIYLLVHPFYNKTGDYWGNVCKDFLQLWKESITNVSQKENSYGILVKSTAPNVPQEFVDELVTHFRESFPWSRRTITKNADGRPINLFKPQFLWDTTNIETVSARGIYVNQCVPRALSEVINSLQVAQEKAHIDFFESDTGCMPDGFVETRYQHDKQARLILPSSRPTLEENLQLTQRLFSIYKKEYNGQV
jgi:hypothetical protein